MIWNLSTQDPKDIYIVGSKVEYTCTSGYYLTGYNTIECTENKTWSSRPGLCISESIQKRITEITANYSLTLASFLSVSACRLGALAEDVIAHPLHGAYGIGDTVTLSCPEGRQLQGESVITCDPSLNFSPDPASITCSPGQ